MGDLHCNKIFFAGCHDNSYIRDLQKHPDEHRKVVLLETTPADSAFQDLQLPILRFETVFRSESLVPKLRAFSVSTRLLQHPTPQHTRMKPPSASGRGRVCPTAATNNWNTGTIYPLSYQGGMKIAKRKRSTALTRRFRLDPPRGLMPTQALESFDIKKIGATNKFCNDHYLKQVCGDDNCIMEHGVKLNTLDLKILRYKARGLQCPSGADCEDLKCYKSHHCPFGLRCEKGSECNFQLHLPLR